MKKLILIFSSLILISTMVLPALAASKNNTYKYYNCTVKVKGKKVDLTKTKPVKIGDSTYLPAIPLLQKVGRKVSYESKVLTIQNGQSIIKVKRASDKIISSDINVAETDKMYEINKQPYLKWSFFRKLQTTVDWFKESKVYVVNDSTKGEVSMHTRFWQSGEYKFDYYMHKDDKYRLGRTLVPKNNKYKYILDVDINLTVKDDIGVRITEYDIATRNKVKEILQMCYPVHYEDVYGYFMKVLREEIHELDYDMYNLPGVSDKYYDNRFFRVAKVTFKGTWVSIAVGKKGVIYEKYPPAEFQRPPSHSPNLDWQRKYYKF